MQTTAGKTLTALTALSAVCVVILACYGLILPAVFAGFVAAFFGACMMEEIKSNKYKNENKS